MSWVLLKKEILEHVLSLRLMLAFVLIVLLLLASSLLFVSNYRSQLEDYGRQTSENQAALSSNLSGPQGLFVAFSWGRQSIYRRPNPVGFVTEGREKDLPNVFKVSAFRLEGPDYSQRGNPLLGDFDVLDWAFIVGIVLSFVAILLASDAINGEKQRGTLRLMLANPVPRARLLIAKYVSTMILLAIPLLLGAVASLLLIAGSGLVPLSSGLWARIGLVLLLSLVYLSVFVVLGLLISTVLKDPQASLVVCLLAWVLLVIVIPSGATLVARLTSAVPEYQAVQQQSWEAWEAAVKGYNRRFPHPDNWIMSGQWSPGEPLMRAFEADQARARVLDQYEDRKIAQVRFGERLACLSPAGLFRSAALSVTGSGVSHYRSFVDQSRRYRETLARFVDGVYPLGKTKPLFSNARSESFELEIKYDSVPKFEEKPISVRDGWSNAITSAGLLGLLNLIFFAATWLLFLRYDAR